MRIALVTDNLLVPEGREGLFEPFLELFPKADVFALAVKPGTLGGQLDGRKVVTTPLQRVPFGVSRPGWFLPLYDGFMAGLDLSSYDLIVSESSVCGKWVRNPRKVPHVCFCHTPMKTLWNMAGGVSTDETKTGFWMGALERADLASNDGVTHFLTGSAYIRERIKRIYGRDSEVLPPPVETDRFHPAPFRGGDFVVLSDGALSPCVKTALNVCARRGWRLTVATDNSELPAVLARAKALLVPDLEDFGVGAVEALASGTPVVAYGRGGVLDFLKDGETGVLYGQQTGEVLESALDRFNSLPPFDSKVLQSVALPYSRARFILRAQEFFRTVYNRLEDGS